jgi:hypothetical protein
MKNVFSIRQIAHLVGREDVTVNARAQKVGAVPFKVDTVNKGLKRYWYNSEQAEKIFRFYRAQEEKDAFKKRKHKPTVFPEIIYVTRTTEIYESRLNYTELNKL